MRTPHAYRTEQNTVYMLLTGMNTAEDSCHGFNKRSLQESLTDELIAQMQQSQIYLRSDPTLTVVKVCVVSDTLLQVISVCNWSDFLKMCEDKSARSLPTSCH